MKTLILGAIIATSTMTMAQVSTRVGDQYREYEVSIVTLAGEAKTVTLAVNTETDDYSYGDPEITGHGFYESSITGSVTEDGKTCDFTTLYSQGDNHERKFKSSVKLCSGLVLNFDSSEALLADVDSVARVSAPGLTKTIGQATVKSKGVKAVTDPWENY